MEVRTTRFGIVLIDESKVIVFPKGLLGFASCTRFCLLKPSEDAAFHWLQSLEDPALAFVVTDPLLFVPEFAVPIRPEQMVELKLTRVDDAKVMVIVNKVDQTLTGNLQGPLVINTVGCVAEQFVLAEKRWTTRHPLVQLEEAAPARAMSA